MVGFPTLDIRFSFSMQISYVQFVLNLSGSASEGFRGSLAIFILHYCPCFLLDLIPVLALCSLCPQARTRTFLPWRCCPTSVWPPSPATCCSFLPCYCQQSLVFITAVLGWLLSYQCLRYTINISPLSSTGTHYSGLKSYFMFRKVCWVNLCYFLCAISLEYINTPLFSQVVSYGTSVIKP